MKRALLIAISALALAGFLIADIAWPKASIAEDTPAEEPAAKAAATPEAATSSAPKEPTAETYDSSSQGTKAEDAAAQSMPSMPGSIEAALDQLNEPITADSASASGVSGGKNDGTAEAASEHNDAPAADENVVR